MIEPIALACSVTSIVRESSGERLQLSQLCRHDAAASNGSLMDNKGYAVSIRDVRIKKYGSHELKIFGHDLVATASDVFTVLDHQSQVAHAARLAVRKACDAHDI
jgi:hypothetical protein